MTDNTIPRDVAQLLITKLDLKQMAPGEARRHASTIYRVKLSGRTREQVSRSIGKAMEPPRTMNAYERANYGH